MDTQGKSKVIRRSVRLDDAEHEALKTWFEGFHTQREAHEAWAGEEKKSRWSLLGLVQRGTGRQDSVERAREILSAKIPKTV